LKIAILTSPNQWYISYAKELAKSINAELLYSHEEIASYDILFILSYHSIIPNEFLERSSHNIVIHASDLPQGRGWAPLFWQVLEGKNDIVFTLFEASNGADTGVWYLKKTLHLDGTELYDELRAKQARHTNAMCLEYIEQCNNLLANTQQGQASYYEKRSAADAKLDVNKSIAEQFNLLRICSNEEFPPFFDYQGKRYSLKIEHLPYESCGK